MALLPVRLLALLSLVSLAFPGPAVAETARLSVDDAVRIAVERNLGLQAETFNPAIAATDIRRARSIYDPTLSAFFDHRGGNMQIGPASPVVDRTRFFDANASLDQLLPTGATASAAFTNLWSKDNLGLSTSRFAEPELTLSLSQPLLKGIGKRVTERGITTADDAMELSLAAWNQKALDTASEARNRFLTLVKARESLATRKASLAVTRQVHEENEGRVKAGVLAAFQLQDSELGVLLREKDLLDAELAERDAADQLRLTLHLPPGTVLELSDTSWTDVPDPSEEEAFGIALRRRPDLSNARTSLRTAEFNEEISRNLALPSLALEGSAGVAGIAPEYGNAFDDMRSGKNPNWAVGLRFSVPLGNLAARADVAAARLKASQARVGVAVLEESAGLEIRTALRALETRRKQDEVARKGVSVAETRLASFLKRGKLGLSTTKDVLDAEANLTQARENLSGARADFQSALTSLWKSTGELLDRHGVQFDGSAIASKTRKGTP
ncbi:TolC family protein [Candidatus Deferrimicrobium sp.]|uniref:TolC family protein n=1 Tax=Candidatus Deferrimicrobium sp. TaxID=3060586 RepID=UPI002ED9758E